MWGYIAGMSKEVPSVPSGEPRNAGALFPMLLFGFAAFYCVRQALRPADKPGPNRVILWLGAAAYGVVILLLAKYGWH